MSSGQHDKTVVTVVAPAVQKPIARDSCLVVIYGPDLGKRYKLDRETMFVGRSSKCEIQVDQESISRNHARIALTPEGVVLRDLGSTNGSYVNDQKIAECTLKDGDFVQIGRAIFKFLSQSNIENAYHEEIYRLATVDGLTQIHNKRHFDEMFPREFGRAQRHTRPLSMIMFDIDHFKTVNDTHGHHTGDQILRQLCQVIRGRIRKEDLFARYGGEEFVVLLPETDLDQARLLAEKIREMVAATQFLVDGTHVPVTISAGVSMTDPSIVTPEDFVRIVDGRLYEAKNAGRNCVRG